jgi:hypothetical protein
MIIPHRMLSPDALRGVIEAFVTREGTDYGAQEVPHSTEFSGGVCHCSSNPPEVRIWRLRNQSRVGTFPPSPSTPHCPACWA